MSRFYATHSDSDSSSPAEESEEEVIPKKIPQASYVFSDDEEDTKRTVRSAKEKRYEAIHILIKSIRNSKKIKDFNKMETSFQEMKKAYEKAKTVIDKEESGVVPRFYISILVEMENLIIKTWEDRIGRKNMSKNNSKSLSSLRQQFRKYIRDFETEMIRFRENPDESVNLTADDSDIDKLSNSDEDNEDEVNEATALEDEGGLKRKKSLVRVVNDDDDDGDDSEDSYWGSSSGDSSLSSEDDDPTITLREKFLKKYDDDENEIKRERRKDKKKERKAVMKSTNIADEDEEGEDDDDWIRVERGALEKPKMFDKDTKITHELVIKKLFEIKAARGKRRTNRKEQIELVRELLAISEENALGVGIYAKLHFEIIAAIFDYNPKVSAAIKPEYWEKCLVAIDALLTILSDNYKQIITGDNIAEESEVYIAPPYKVGGCFLSVVERMDEEFIKVLKSCDAHSIEYVERLKDEPKVLSLLERADAIIQRAEKPLAAEVCRIYMKKIEHLYFKFDPKILEDKNGESKPTKANSLQEIDVLCKFVYSKDSTDRLRTHAILCHIYHHAIHDNWFDARDLMLMSHLQDSIGHSDPPTQILYNRTMVQLGLCGFRHGEIKEAHNALLDIQMGGRSKELLAQGLLPQRHNERSVEQEKIEKQRQMPFHMHINLEMLECVYLVCAMLIEIPYMAAHEFDARHRMISKSYYQQLRSSERQLVVGPPESMREHIVAASKAMRNGDWKKTRDFIICDKMNSKVWDLFYNSNKVRSMLIRKIQEESLRTYLFTYSKVYDSISVETLAVMYELEHSHVHAIVSKMIISEDMMASMDEPSQCLIMHRTEPTRLQSISIQLADKISQLVDNNERLLELRSSGWTNKWNGAKEDRRVEVGYSVGRYGGVNERSGFGRFGQNRFGGGGGGVNEWGSSSGPNKFVGSGSRSGTSKVGSYYADNNLDRQRRENAWTSNQNRFSSIRN